MKLILVGFIFAGALGVGAGEAALRIAAFALHVLAPIGQVLR